MSTPLPVAHYEDVVCPDRTRLRVATWPGTTSGVIAVHGLSASHLNWLALADALNGSVQLIAPDLRGRGDSDKPASGYGIRQHADDVADVARAKGFDRVIVVGHSMGAYIAEQVAVRHPELVAGLVLVDGGYVELPAGLTPEFMVANLLPSITARLSVVFPDREALFAEFRKHPAFAGPGEWSAYSEAYYDYDVEPVPDGTGVRAKCHLPAIEADYVAMTEESLRTDLAAIRCPVHLLRAEFGRVYAGIDDPLLPDPFVAAMHALVPQLTDEVVAGTNHYTIGISAPGAEAVAAAVTAMLPVLAGE